MKRKLTAYITQEDDWYVAQCLEVDVASQGGSEAEAMTNLREALHLHFLPPVATELPRLLPVEFDLAA